MRHRPIQLIFKLCKILKRSLGGSCWVVGKHADEIDVMVFRDLGVFCLIVHSLKDFLHGIGQHVPGVQYFPS